MQECSNKKKNKGNKEKQRFMKNKERMIWDP